MYSVTHLRVVHVDDSPGSLQAFKDALTNYPEVEYLKGFTDPEQALQFIDSTPVDVVFLDVEMPGKDGLWLADKLKDKDISIVFLTSHAQYALHAFEACALDYILKPVNDASISKIIRKLTKYRQKDQQFRSEQIKELQNTYLVHHRPAQRIFVNVVGETKIIRLEEVLYFMASTNYTIIVMKDGTRFTTSKTMRKYADAVETHPDFIRIHRSYLINKNGVSSIIKKGKQHRFFVQMVNSDRLEISYARKDEIIEKLVS